MKTKRTLYIKATLGTRHGAYGNYFRFDLPKNGKPGKWHVMKGEPEFCKHGLHFISPNWRSTMEHGVQPENNTRLWVVQVDPKMTLTRRGKGVSTKLRFTREVQGWNKLVREWNDARSRDEERAVEARMKALLRKQRLGDFAR